METKFIELTLVDGTKGIFNLNYILRFEPYHDNETNAKSIVSQTDSNCFSVKIQESMEEISRILLKINNA